MSNKDMWNRKPVGETILGKIAREYVLRKHGLYTDDRPKKSREQVDKEFAQCVESFRNDYPSDNND